MAYVALISENYVKDNSVINANVDASLIRPAIRLAQEKYIHPVLGTNLYNTVMGLVSGAPTVTLSGSYGTLLHTYIQPCLLWYSVSESIIPIAYKVTNQDVVRMNATYSQPAELNEILHLKDDAKNNAEWYAERLHLYLVENADTFTEYNNPGDGVDTIRPKKRVFSEKISLGKQKTKSSLNQSSNAEWISPKDRCFD